MQQQVHAARWHACKTCPRPLPQVLPALLEVVSGGAPSQDLLERLIYALDAYVEHMSPEAIVPYMGPLMQLLGAVLSRPDVGAHKEALSCLASIIVAADKSFQPYAGVGLASAHAHDCCG